MDISVVTSLYRSEKHVKELHFKLFNVLSSITNDFEIIFVNDFSPDLSLEYSKEIISNQNSKLKVIDLSRNFGQHKALMTGIEMAKGEIIFMMDSDLEENPDEIKRFYELYKGEYQNVDVIYGVQENRKGRFLEKRIGFIFHIVFGFLLKKDLKSTPTPFRLMTRKYVNNLIKFKEKEFFFLGISFLVGFEQVGVPIVKNKSSKTSYNFIKRFHQSFNAIVSFSDSPLKIVFFTGIFVFILSLIHIFYLFIRYFYLGVGVEGWISIMTSIWFIGGIIICSIGIVGIYISKIFHEVKNRPFTIIKNIYE